MKKKICILGSTGIIGKLTLNIISKNKKLFNVSLLSCNKNYSLLIKQIKKFKPKFVYINRETSENNELKKVIKKYKVKVISDLSLIKNYKFDITISAISGFNGLKPTLDIIKLSKKIGIVNKESIICGWHLIKKKLTQYNTEFIPLDSEHFSIFNLLSVVDKKKFFIKKIFLPASGGPFFFTKKTISKNILYKDVISHPKWRMGVKNSIDSANLMNKILEVVEASLLFEIPIKKFKILIHPESFVHSVLQLKNNFFIMNAYPPDMGFPIENLLLNNEKSFISKFSENFFNSFITKKIKINFLKIDKRFSYINVILNFLCKKNYKYFIFLCLLNEVLVDNYVLKKKNFNKIIKNLIFNLKRTIFLKKINSCSFLNISDINNFYKYIIKNIIIN